MYYTYIIRTESGSLYTGIAKDLFRRMKEHAEQKPSAAKYTKSHRITSLEGVWSSADRGSASRLEAAIKTLSKGKKEAVIQNPPLLFSFLPRLEKEDYLHHPKATLDLFLGKITLGQLL